ARSKAWPVRWPRRWIRRAPNWSRWGRRRPNGRARATISTPRPQSWPRCSRRRARAMGVGLKRLAAQMLAAPPVWRLLRRRALAGDPLTTLCYHTLGPDRGGPEAWTVLRMEDFRRQVALLRAHYDIVSLDQALAPRAPGATRPR